MINFSCSNYTQEELIGVYVNNYDELPEFTLTPPESPGRKDTLILYEDSTFLSLSYGNGVYHIYKTQNGSLSIDLSPGYEMTVKRKSFFDRRPIFVISGDASYYYQKID